MSTKGQAEVSEKPGQSLDRSCQVDCQSKALLYVPPGRDLSIAVLTDNVKIMLPRPLLYYTGAISFFPSQEDRHNNPTACGDKWVVVQPRPS